jgi:nucleoside-diphosphate-sugar epimerase
MSERILLLGSNGQIGTVLTQALQEKYGSENIIGSDLREPSIPISHFEIIDVTNRQLVDDFIGKYKPDHVYHLAAILSAKGESNPILTWDINVSGLLHVMDACLKHNVKRLFFPSSIAVFGKTTPRIMTPQEAPLVPETVYGMSKVAGENWCNYYHKRYGLDVRSLRYPGVIGYQSIPEGGTTDYAVEIYHGALKSSKYKCFLEAGTNLPMLYMPDAIRATIELMEAAPENISVRYSYNLAGMTFAPQDIATSIQKLIPNFTIDYHPDFRQEIAASWSESIDDQVARKDWNWHPEYDLNTMTLDMIENIKRLYDYNYV